LSYNPCVLLNMPNKFVHNREPFNYDELKHLFNILDTLDNRKYIYYILAYSGMRSSELWKCNIGVSEDNIIYFDLRARDLQLKTSSSHRIIPLHNELLKMGIDQKLASLQLEFTQAIMSKYFNTVIKPQVTDNKNLSISNTTNALEGGVFSHMKNMISLHRGLSKSLKLNLVDYYLVCYKKK